MRSQFRSLRFLFAAALPMYMSAEVDAGIAAAKNLETVGDSVVAAFKAQGQIVIDAAGDKAKVVAIGQEMIAKADVWSKAIQANTPPPTTFPDLASFTAGIASYTGPATLDGNAVTTAGGSDPALTYFTQTDGSISTAAVS